MYACGRTHVHHVIGGQDGVAVVLDHQHGVAEVDQASKRFDEASVVAGVKSDRRLVEHIQDAAERGADLCG